MATIVGLIAIKFENETFNETRRKASKSSSSTVQKRQGTGGLTEAQIILSFINDIM